MNDIRGARCLDAFAGSGALGFEALSRGASDVVLVDSSPRACEALTRTTLSFNKQQICVINRNALDYLQTIREPYDIIFLDPPFRGNCIAESLSILNTGPGLRQGGLLYVESPVETMPDPAFWRPRKSKKAGQVWYALFEKY